jgi:formylglycine-generating enzyme required for sulfatase activity
MEERGELGVGLGEDQFREIPPGPAVPSPFLLQVTPVTQLQWRQISGGNPSWFTGGGDLRPVERVSFGDVQAFLGLLNIRCAGRRYRLPSEVEWEHAVRAGAPGDTVSPHSLDDCAWHSGNSHGRTHPVGRKVPNAWGLHDMLGNVWEWVLYRSRSEGSVHSGILRGGAWNSPRLLCRYDARLADTPTNRFSCNGLRLVLDMVMTPP